MNATTQRIILALAACEGMTDADLAARGKGGFLKMINRKRGYAQSARYYGAVLEKVVPALEAARKELEAMKAAQATLEQLDAPVEDVSEAAALLAGISGKPGVSDDQGS